MLSRSESMYKTNIFALKEDRAKVLEELHIKGVMQLVDLKSSNLNIGQSVLQEEHKKSSDLLLRVSRIVNILKMPPMVLTTPQSLFGLDLPEKEKIKRMSEKQIIKESVFFLKENEETLINLEQEYTSSQERKEQLNDLLISIKLLNNLNVPFNILRSSEKISIITGKVPTVKLEELKSEVDKELEGEGEVMSKSLNAKDALVVIVSFVENASKINFSAKKHGMTSLIIPEIDAEDPISHIEKEIVKCDTTKVKVFKEIKKIRKLIYTKSILIREELEILKDKTEAIHKMRESETFFVMQGWVPESQLDEVKSIKNAVITTNYQEPLVDDEKNAEIPVKMNNANWLKPFEMITELYSAPKYKDLDPTFIVGPLFLIFAGFMLTDFFYGLGMVILGVFIIKKFGKYDPSLKQIATSIWGIGAFSMFFGILTGSYLGDLPKYLIGMDSATLAIWKDPLTDPLYFLIISIIVALIHVNAGLVLGSIEDFRKKQYKNFISERLVWWLLQIAIACLALASTMPFLSLPGKIIGILSVLVIVAMKGPLGLLDITGFMGDVISYSRLFALALSTAGIAMTMNLLANLLWPIPYGIGIVSALLVFLGGHIFSFAMNSLGSFVHSIRLQFVEFFGKFYEGGGTVFEPFKEGRNYTIIEEEDRK